MRTRYFLTIGLVFVVLSTVSAQTGVGQMNSTNDTKTMNVLSKQARPFIVTNASATDIVQKLRKEGLRVCFEQNSATSTAIVSLTVGGSPAKDLLGDVVARLPGYTWRNPKGTDIVMVFPAESSALNWYVSTLDATNRPFWDVLVKDDMLGLKEHNVVCFYRGFTQPLSFLVNVRFKDKPVVECLNELIADHPSLCWTLTLNPRGTRVLTFQFLQAHM